ncbi:spermatogenesis associated 6-like protein [Mastacembelus armatus]|uniref:spermatogenesis associated 6-like protein n=1 Tax=Mastacembelus armatus TaxID=205130 RepID=UPI000E45EEEF|nr:spermatogenesis associated 6-like protein [Mastacembelus armatus]XP_026154351.1 spermatogenesis associated 6-like protein [Mastacembelus armatus]
MSRKALKVVVEVKFRAVSCPGVHLPAKDDLYLSMCFLGQYRQSEAIPAVFPLLFYEKMTFEKIYRHALDPGDITVMLEYETVRIELVQLIPPTGDTLACFEEDARHFLFPEPRLLPSFSGVDQEVLMTRAPHFPGIAPRLEFSTKTSIIECSADAEINIYPNVSMRPVIKRNRKRSSKPKTTSPQGKQHQTLGRRQGDRMDKERHRTPRSLSHSSRSQSLPQMRDKNTQSLGQLTVDSAAPGLADQDKTSSSRPSLASWPRASGSVSQQRSALLTNYSSPLTRSSSTVRFSPAGRRKSLPNGVVSRTSGDDSSSNDSFDYHCGTNPSSLWRSYREQARHDSSHREWEEVHERVQGLLTTPKALRRLVYGATATEVERVLAKTSITP